jgi:hypothetical protein
MTTTIEPWVQAGLERMERRAPNRYWKVMGDVEQERQAPNRYWKVMGAVEQERRAAQLERQLARTEALKVETWKKERAEWKEAKKQEERDRLYRSWKARQPERGSEEPLISDKEGGLLVMGAAVCCALAAPLTAAGAAFGLLCFFGHYSD